MNLIKPARLKKNANIAFISLAGVVSDIEAVKRGKDYFESCGYNVILSDNIFDKNRYLAGDDVVKIAELHRFFSDDSIDAIVAVRGGYGSIRLINSLDYDLICQNAKVFCGYSDITALSLMMLKKSGLITYSAPMIQSDFSYDSVSQFTMSKFFTAISTDEEIKINISDIVYKDGFAKGILWGGNLSTVVSLCGLDFIPDEPFLFFAEDLNEDVYKIDRMFNQLLNITQFAENVKAFILGDFLNVDNAVWLDEFFNELALRLDIPIVKAAGITHAKDKITLPIGANAVLNDRILVIK